MKQDTLENILAYAPVALMATLGWITIPFVLAIPLAVAFNSNNASALSMGLFMAFIILIACCCPVGWIVLITTSMLHAHRGDRYKWLGWTCALGYGFLCFFLWILAVMFE